MFNVITTKTIMDDQDYENIPALPTIDWNKVIPRNPEQQILIDWFAQFNDFHERLVRGNELRDNSSRIKSTY